MLILLLLTIVQTDFLILKNGKQIKCERFERDESKVIIYMKNNSFALPVTAVDWKKTRAVQKAWEEKLARDRAAANVKKPKRTMEITRNSLYARKPPKEKPKQPEVTRNPVRCAIKLVDEHILVKGQIGKRSHWFLLDTRTPGGFQLNPAVVGTSFSGKTVDLAFGDYFSSLAFQASELPAVGGIKPAGVLRRDFSNDHRFVIDRDNKEITLFPPGSWKYETGNGWEALERRAGFVEKEIERVAGQSDRIINEFYEDDFHSVDEITPCLMGLDGIHLELSDIYYELEELINGPNPTPEQKNFVVQSRLCRSLAAQVLRESKAMLGDCRHLWQSDFGKKAKERYTKSYEAWAGKIEVLDGKLKKCLEGF